MKHISARFLVWAFISSSTHAFQIGQLLSTCVDACQRGCDEVRAVRRALIETPSTKALEWELKDQHDPRSALTIADHASQAAIVGSLLAEWGDKLHIVGEEDDVESRAAGATKKFAPLRRNMMDDDIGEESVDIDPEDVTVFVDPLDGTREFVEGRLENCQVLVGIAIKGVAVAGAIGIPFPAGDLTTEATIVYGLDDVGTGVLGAPLTRGPFPLERNIDGIKKPRPHVATGDNPVDMVVDATKKVIKQYGGSHVIYGGAGNKILAAALGEVAYTIQHKVGGPWDLCAPEAVAKAMGAGMSDLFGEEIQIYKKDAPPRCNERGFLVTSPGSNHGAFVATVLRSPKVQEYQKSFDVASKV